MKFMFTPLLMELKFVDSCVVHESEWKLPHDMSKIKLDVPIRINIY